MKKTLLCVVLAACAAASAQAQNRDGSVSLDNQFVIYKWCEGNVPLIQPEDISKSKYCPPSVRSIYEKSLKRGITNFTCLNEQGMEICKDRPYANETGSNIIRPVRPESMEMAGHDGNAAADENLPQGSISREQRCDLARENIGMMRNKTTVYEDDGNGNLVPLSDDAVAQRMQEAQAQVAEFCQ